MKWNKQFKRCIRKNWNEIIRKLLNQLVLILVMGDIPMFMLIPALWNYIIQWPSNVVSLFLHCFFQVFSVINFPSNWTIYYLESVISQMFNVSQSPTYNNIDNTIIYKKLLKAGQPILQLIVDDEIMKVEITVHITGSFFILCFVNRCGRGEQQ